MVLTLKTISHPARSSPMRIFRADRTLRTPDGAVPACVAGARRPVLGRGLYAVDGRSTGFVVGEYLPYEADLAWDDTTEPAEIGPWSSNWGGRP